MLKINENEVKKYEIKITFKKIALSELKTK